MEAKTYLEEKNMFCKNLFSVISLTLFVFICNTALAACPSADVTGDCFVDMEDFALMAKQWLTTDSNVPDDMAYIPDGEFEMGDHHNDDPCDPCEPCELPCGPDELPVHTVLVDAFFMSKYEITNQQYCDYLNDANSLGQIKVVNGKVYGSVNNKVYCDTHSYDDDSQIDHNDLSGVFSVRLKGGRDMSDDPMVEVSWYGAASYCNWRSGQEGYEACYNLSTWECDFSKKGYRLATEAEWEYAARGGEQSPYYRFPWGDTISHSQANYYSYWQEGSPVYPYDVSPTSGYHPDWNDGIMPYTSVVGSFSANGYGLYDIAGNVWEWCNDWHDGNYYDVSPYDNPTGPVSGINRVFRDGSWRAGSCRVADRDGGDPTIRIEFFGFRIVLDLN
jgi:formylglycine-generating enzyme required for sulfatase activity